MNNAANVKSSMLVSSVRQVHSDMTASTPTLNDSIAEKVNTPSNVS